MTEYITTSNAWIRVYYVPNEDRNGFKASVKEIQRSSGNFSDEWLDPESEIEEKIEVTALFDGIRHIQFSDKGYMNYPEMSEMIEIFQILSELERKYCWDK